MLALHYFLRGRGRVLDTGHGAEVGRVGQVQSASTKGKKVVALDDHIRFLL